MTDINTQKPSHHISTEAAFLKLHDLACNVTHSTVEVAKKALKPVASYALDKVGQHGYVAASALLGMRAAVGVASAFNILPAFADFGFDLALFATAVAASEVTGSVAPEHKDGLNRFKTFVYGASIAGGTMDLCLGVTGGNGSVLQGLLAAMPSGIASAWAYKRVRNEVSDEALRRDPKTQYTTDRMAEASFSFTESRLEKFGGKLGKTIGHLYGESVTVRDGLQDDLNFGAVVIGPGWGKQIIGGRKQVLDANEIRCIRDAVAPLADQLNGPAEAHRLEAVKHVLECCDTAIARLEPSSPSAAA